MKYVGEIYQGDRDKYNTQKSCRFDDPYDALRDANKKWEANPENQVGRLLVVIGQDDQTQNEKRAYFQFLDFGSCEEYIKNKTDIQWTTSEKTWNGNAGFMK